MRVLTDFHHSSLLRATNMLFGDRLSMDVYRPIGMEWFEEGFWAVNDQVDTARQFLDFNSQPIDNTVPLNNVDETLVTAGWCYINDPGGESSHRACTLEYFKQNPFDICIASIPQHIPMYKELIKLYNPDAKLIVQMGNEWPVGYWVGNNVLASVKPRYTDATCNPMFYHQEFDLDIFRPAPVPTDRNVYSFINILQNMPTAWRDFTGLEMVLGAKSGFKFKSFGGQCRDGNMTGPQELADKMREAMFIFHVKEGGDGFGHIIYNAYAVGRPIITRSSYYKDRLAEELMVDGTFVDLDKHNLPEAVNIINGMLQSGEVKQMGERAHEQFNKVVDYKKESEEISEWLRKLS